MRENHSGVYMVELKEGRLSEPEIDIDTLRRYKETTRKYLEHYTDNFDTHELKILPEYFQDVKSGKKNFELRKNDRNYKVGDHLLLREYDNEKGFTGSFVEVGVTYILKDCPEYGLDREYCILSFKMCK